MTIKTFINNEYSLTLFIEQNQLLFQNFEFRACNATTVKQK